MRKNILANYHRLSAAEKIGIKPVMFLDLCRIEKALKKIDTQYCNWEISPVEYDKTENRLMKKDWSMTSAYIFHQNDTRGCTLYISDQNLKSVGWISLSGYKCFKADNGETFLSNILPETECTYKVWFNDKEILIQN